MSSTATPDPFVKEGWVQMPNAKRSHYIRGGRALCGRWLFLGKIYADDQGAKYQLPDDCKGCWAKLEKEGTSREK